MICSSAFWKQKCENLKNISLTFFKFQSIPATLSLARGTNRYFYCTGVIIFNKVDNYFVVSSDRQTFLGFEMTANLRDTSPLNPGTLGFQFDTLNAFFFNLNAQVVNSNFFAITQPRYILF